MGSICLGTNLDKLENVHCLISALSFVFTKIYFKRFLDQDESCESYRSRKEKNIEHFVVKLTTGRSLLIVIFPTLGHFEICISNRSNFDFDIQLKMHDKNALRS